MAYNQTSRMEKVLCISLENEDRRCNLVLNVFQIFAAFLASHMWFKFLRVFRMNFQSMSMKAPVGSSVRFLLQACCEYLPFNNKIMKDVEYF